MLRRKKKITDIVKDEKAILKNQNRRKKKVMKEIKLILQIKALNKKFSQLIFAIK